MNNRPISLSLDHDRTIRYAIFLAIYFNFLVPVLELHWLSQVPSEVQSPDFLFLSIKKEANFDDNLKGVFNPL